MADKPGKKIEIIDPSAKGKQDKIEQQRRKEEEKEDPACPPKIEEALKKKGIFLLDKLGYGSFSRVFKAKYKNKDVACKVIDLDKTSMDYRNKFLPRELYTLKRLHHPNIVCIYDIITFGNLIYIFMDLCEGGDILDYLKANGPMSEEKAKSFFKQTCDGLRYVHINGICHRDLKAENILLDSQGFAKITDFGFSRIVFDPKTGRRVASETYCGSVAYCSPDLLKTAPYNPMLSDCWSLGICLYVMLNNGLPFDDSDPVKMLQNQLARKWVYNKDVEAKLSNEVKDLINKLLEPDPAKRLTIHQTLRHVWIANCVNNTPQLDFSKSKEVKSKEVKSKNT